MKMYFLESKDYSATSKWSIWHFIDDS